MMMLSVMIHGLANRKLDFYCANSLKQLSTYRQTFRTHYPDNEATSLCSCTIMLCSEPIEEKRPMF